MSIGLFHSYNSVTAGEQSQFNHLHAIKVRQQFDELKFNGISGNQEAVLSVIENLHGEYEIEKLSHPAQAMIDRSLANVGLDRKQVIAELDARIAQFRDNFRPSTMKPGRM